MFHPEIMPEGYSEDTIDELAAIQRSVVGGQWSVFGRKGSRQDAKGRARELTTPPRL